MFSLLKQQFAPERRRFKGLSGSSVSLEPLQKSSSFADVSELGLACDAVTGRKVAATSVVTPVATATLTSTGGKRAALQTDARGLLRHSASYASSSSLRVPEAAVDGLTSSSNGAIGSSGGGHRRRDVPEPEELEEESGHSPLSKKWQKTLSFGNISSASTVALDDLQAAAAAAATAATCTAAGVIAVGATRTDARLEPTNAAADLRRVGDGLPVDQSPLRGRRMSAGRGEADSFAGPDTKKGRQRGVPPTCDHPEAATACQQRGQQPAKGSWCAELAGSSLYEDLEKTYEDTEEMREFIRQQRDKPPALMDDFVDFVSHQIVDVMNAISRYSEAFNEVRTVHSDGRAMKREFAFYAEVNFNILPAFHRVIARVNEYSSRSSAHDSHERYDICLDIRWQLCTVNGLITGAIDSDDFFAQPKKDKHFVHSFRGASSATVQTIRQIRYVFLGFGALHKRMLQWFGRIPTPKQW